MVSPAAARAADHHKIPLLLGGRSVTLERSSEEVENIIQPSQHKSAQCLWRGEKRWASTAEAAENSLRRKTRHAAHLATLNRAFSAQRFDRSICWAHYQRKDGCERWRCGQGRCPLSHEPSQLSVRFCCAPPRLRTFFETETYPAEYREGSEEKLRVNAALVYHASEHVAQAHVTAMEMRASRQHLPSPFRCLVLAALEPAPRKSCRMCQSRLTAERIDCPNLCTATFEAQRVWNMHSYLGCCERFSTHTAARAMHRPRPWLPAALAAHRSRVALCQAASVNTHWRIWITAVGSTRDARSWSCRRYKISAPCSPQDCSPAGLCSQSRWLGPLRRSHAFRRKRLPQ